MQADLYGAHHLVQIVEDAIAHLVLADVFPDMAGGIQLRALVSA